MRGFENYKRFWNKCVELGINTFGDLDYFAKTQVDEGENLEQAIERYHAEVFS